jgi:hypothetical protein
MPWREPLARSASGARASIANGIESGNECGRSDCAPGLFSLPRFDLSHRAGPNADLDADRPLGRCKQLHQECEKDHHGKPRDGVDGPVPKLRASPVPAGGATHERWGNKKRACRNAAAVSPPLRGYGFEIWGSPQSALVVSSGGSVCPRQSRRAGWLGKCLREFCGNRLCSVVRRRDKCNGHPANKLLKVKLIVCEVSGS